MHNPTHQLADAICDVTVAIQRAIEDGHRSQAIDANDLIEVFLAIADRLAPPIQDTANRVEFPCPDCGEIDADRLNRIDDEFIRCDACGTIYSPVK